MTAIRGRLRMGNAWWVRRWLAAVRWLGLAVGHGYDEGVKMKCDELIVEGFKFNLVVKIKLY